MLEIDALQALDERRNEVPARLLAVCDDIDACGFLVGEQEPHGVALAFLEEIPFEEPRRPELLRLGEPARLGKTAGDGGLQQQNGLRARSDVPRSEAAADVYLGTVAVADQLEATLACGTVCRDPIADLGRAVTDGGQALVQEVDQRALVALLEMADAFPVERLVDFAHRGLADRVAQAPGGEERHADLFGV